MKNSEYIENFLTFLRTLQSDYRVAQMNEDEANKETQDILHRLEFGDNSYEDMKKLAIAMIAVRQKRRRAKNTIAEAKPILEWAERNDKTLKTLEQCLGETRKVEKELENRHYLAKTDIISEMLGCKDELWTDRQNIENDEENIESKGKDQ